jgi:hypothetical protein
VFFGNVVEESQNVNTKINTKNPNAFPNIYIIKRNLTIVEDLGN